MSDTGAETSEQLRDFRNQYPAWQSFHSGKWGWRRANGCANINTARFDTEAEAVFDRNQTITAGKIDRENGQPY